MKYRVVTLTFVLLAAIFGFSMTAFAAATAKIELVSQDNVAYRYDSGAANVVDIPALKFKIVNTGDAIQTITAFVFTTGAGTAGLTAGEMLINVYRDTNANGVLDNGDTRLKAASVDAAGLAGTQVTVTTDAAETVAVGATKQFIATAEIVNAGAVADDGDVLELTLPIATGLTGGVGVAATTTASLNAENVANVPTIVVADGAGTVTTAAAATLPNEVVGNSKQAMVVASFKLTADATVSHMFSGFTMSDGGWTDPAGDQDTDVSNYYVYLDQGTIGRYDAADILLAPAADVNGPTDAIAFTRPVSIPAGATKNFLLVFDLSGTAGIAGAVTEATAKEEIGVDIAAADFNLESAVVGSASYTGPTIGMVPLFVTAASTVDFDHDGLIEAVKITFSDNINDSRWSTMAAGVDYWLEPSAGDNAVGGDDATTTAFNPSLHGDAANNNVIYVEFTPSSMAIADRYTNGKPEFGVAGSTLVNSSNTKTLLPFTPQGGATPLALAETTDGATAVVYGATTADADGDGKIDRVTVSFSEPMSGVNPTGGVTFTSPVTAFGTNGVYSVVSGAVTGSTIDYTITESANAYDTESTPSFNYVPSVGSLNDANGLELSAYGAGALSQMSPTVDHAAPVIVAAATQDRYTDESLTGNSNYEASTPNGRVDTLVLTFSERVNSVDNAATPDDANLNAIVANFAVNHVQGVMGSFTSPATSTASFHPAPALVHSGSNGSTDTQSTLTIFVREASSAALAAGMTNGGDTGAPYTFNYTGLASLATSGLKDSADNGMTDVTAAPSTDDAAPFIVDGMMKADATTAKTIGVDAEAGDWTSEKFSNVWTVDSAKGTPNSDFNVGDGYIDGFHIFFSEPVSFANATNLASAFTVTPIDTYSALTITGVDANNDGTVTAADNDAVFTDAIFYATSTKVANKWDTGTTPSVKFVGGVTVDDAADNVLAASTNRLSFDNAKPVVVRALGSVETKNITVTWSEPVYKDNVETTLDQAWAASDVFGYTDKNAAGASGLSTDNTKFTHTAATNTSVIETDVVMTVADVEQDSLWVKADMYVYDNSVDTATAQFRATYVDNRVAFDATGIGFKMTIDDKIAPWITAATTLDVDGDGKIDNIRFTFSEPIKDSTVNGYALNAMGADVSANWKLSGYTGTAKFNFFDPNAGAPTDATKIAANAADQPIFWDNAVDDNILYLALDEAGVPASVTGLGSTDYSPVITWSGNTLSDKKPNLLETNAAHFNGTVTDAVGPVLMAAEYNSTTTMKVKFSEDVVASTVSRTDFSWTMSNAGINYENNVAQITEPTPGVVVLRTTSVFQWENDMAGSLAKVVAGGTIDDPDKDGTGTADLQVAGVQSNTQVYANAHFFKADKAANPARGTSAASVAITINLTGGENPGGEVSSVTKAALNAVASNLSISNKNVTRVYFNGTAAANDTVLVKLVDADGDAVETTVVANGVGNFSGQIDASALHNGQVTIQAGKAVAGVVSAWYTGASYAKETIEVGAPADLVVTDVANDQGGFVDVTFTKSENDVANPSDFYAVDYYVIQGKKGDNWFTVNTLLPDGNTDTTYRAANVYVGSIDSLRINAHVKLNGASKVADAPDAMSSAYAFGTGTAIDNILPGAFVGFTADGTQGTGVNVQWTAPADHGLFNAQYNVWGVDGYEVYRRVVGTTEYTLAGTVAPGATQFVDTVANGSTVYEYMVKAVDGSQFVITSISKAMASKGADFTGDGVVSLGDLVLLGSNWDLKSTDADFVVNYDLNKDGVISLGDLVLLGNAWDQAAKVAKAAGEMPVASNVAFQMVPTSSENGSMYYVSISTQNAADIKGVAFGLTYDASKFEFVPETVTGLVDMQVVKPGQGIISIASLYNSDTFSGTITLGFKSKGMNSSMNVEMVNAEVAMNGALYAVGNAAGVTLKALPSTYALSQNFPNPFNPTTTIEYSIPTTGNVSLVVYNVAGQKVRTLVNDSQSANFYKVVWDGKNDNGMTVGTGTYFYKLVSGNYSKIVKMTLMK